MALGNFLAELKRRHVYRAGGAYAVVAFGLIEIVSNVAPMFDLPGWVGRAVVFALIVGFPVALFTAWMIEAKPAEGASTTSMSKLDFALMGALALVAGLLIYQQVAPAPQKAPSIAASADGVSIAVLPFLNLSSDPEQEFFSDGMTEEITSALAEIKSLKVVARTSAFQFKGENKDMRAIGQALGAANLLEGSVRKAGTRVRITGQLIRAGDGTHLWTASYDRDLKDVFAVQEEVAKAIAAALQVPLGLNAGDTLVASRNISPENYQQYLRAKALYRARNAIDRYTPLEAIAVLEQLVAAEPGYAPAWALLALVYQRSYQGNVILRERLVDRYKELRPIIETTWAKARAAAQRAIDLDPRNAEAYAAMGLAQPIGKVEAREDFLKRALELEPSNPDVLSEVGLTLVQVGRVKEGLTVLQKLRAIEPFAPTFNANTAMALMADGQNEEALALAKTLPATLRTRWRTQIEAYLALGHFAEAADAILSTPAGMFKPGEAEAAARVLRKAPGKISPQELPALTEPLSIVYLYVGAPERMVVHTDNPIIDVTWPLPGYAPVRKTEAFKSAVRDFGLIDYWRARGWPALCRPVGADDFMCD